MPLSPGTAPLALFLALAAALAACGGSSADQPAVESPSPSPSPPPSPPAPLVGMACRSDADCVVVSTCCGPAAAHKGEPKPSTEHCERQPCLAVQQDPVVGAVCRERVCAAVREASRFTPKLRRPKWGAPRLAARGRPRSRSPPRPVEKHVAPPNAGAR